MDEEIGHTVCIIYTAKEETINMKFKNTYTSPSIEKLEFSVKSIVSLREKMIWNNYYRYIL